MIQSAAVQLNSQLHTLESRVHLLLQKIWLQWTILFYIIYIVKNSYFYS
jgi:hypothetical protein